jgi:hypothetical protein
MSENTQTQEQGTQVQVQANGATTEADTTVKMYATKAEAEANKPTQLGKKRLFEVAKDGTARWVWANGYDHALASAARVDGYTVSTGVKQAPVTKEAAAAKVMEMSDDEFKALVAARKAAAKGQK